MNIRRRRRRWSSTSFWTRIHGKLVFIRHRPVNGRHATHANKPSPVTTHVEPTKQATDRLTRKQKRLLRIMHATVGNPYRWTYNFVRPLYLPKRRLTDAEFASAASLKAALAKLVTRYRSDCSFGGKTLFWLAGYVDDPTGENWGPWGNTATTYQHLEKRPGLDNAYQPSAADLAKCKVGDIGLVGFNGSLHFWIVMEPGPNPLVWSDGFDGAPNSYRALDDPRRPISVCIPKD